MIRFNYLDLTGLNPLLKSSYRGSRMWSLWYNCVVREILYISQMILWLKENTEFASGIQGSSSNGMWTVNLIHNLTKLYYIFKMSFIREIGEGIRGLGSIAVLLFMEQLQATGKPDQYLKYEKKRAIMNVDPYIQIMPTRSKTFEQFPVILK